MRGSKWQHIYLNACIINWFSEIFFVQLIEILWIDFMIAGSIRNKVLAISEFLNSIGFMIYEKHMNDNISLNPNLTLEWIEKFPTKKWSWKKISKNKHRKFNRN